MMTDAGERRVVRMALEDIAEALHSYRASRLAVLLFWQERFPDQALFASPATLERFGLDGATWPFIRANILVPEDLAVIARVPGMDLGAEIRVLRARSGGAAINSAVGVECPHGYDVCPMCDPCTCRRNETKRVGEQSASSGRKAPRGAPPGIKKPPPPPAPPRARP